MSDWHRRERHTNTRAKGKPHTERKAKEEKDPTDHRRGGTTTRTHAKTPERSKTNKGKGERAQEDHQMTEREIDITNLT